MATTTSKTSSSSSSNKPSTTYSSSYTSNVPTYQQAYNMSADWLSRTVAAGQDTAAKQAQAKDYSMAQEAARGYTYSQSAKAQNPLQESQSYSSSQMGKSKTVSSTTKLKTSSTPYVSDFDKEMEMFATQNRAAQQQKELDNYYKSAVNNQDFANQTAATAREYAHQDATLSKQNVFAASESEKQRQLQSYLGNVDANSRVTSSLYSSLGSLNQNPYNFQYW